MQRPVRTLPGTSDLVGDRLAEVTTLQQLLLEGIVSWGYQRIETPLLEEADLFLRKSGGELAARLYGIEEPSGRRITLRPEYTASVIRAFIAQNESGNIPSRWCYAGPVLRREPLETGQQRQITQVGVELVGVAGPLADAEMLAIACEGISRAGIRQATLTLGHLDVLGGLLLAFGLSDRAELFLLSRLSLLKNGDQSIGAVLEEARLLRLLPNGAENDSVNQTFENLNLEEARTALRQIVTALAPGWIGSRDIAEVESRFLDKLREAEDPEKLRQAVQFLADLAHIRGDGATVLRETEVVVKRYGLDAKHLEPLARLVDVMDASSEMEDVEKVWDLGFARGLAYYTGVVFELTHPGLSGRPLGGGGRYDGLVRALGGPDLPALGFAYSVESLEEARRIEGVDAFDLAEASVEALVAPERLEDAASALQEARRLRSQGDGTTVVLYSEPDDLTGAQAYARTIDAQSLVIVGSGGVRRETLGRE